MSRTMGFRMGKMAKESESYYWPVRKFRDALPGRGGLHSKKRDARSHLYASLSMLCTRSCVVVVDIQIHGTSGQGSTNR